MNLTFNLEATLDKLNQFGKLLVDWLNSPGFYFQLVVILVAVGAAYLLAYLIRQRTPVYAHAGEGSSAGLRGLFYSTEPLLFPILLIIVLALLVDASDQLFEESQLVRVSQSVAVVFLLYSVITNFFVHSRLFKNLIAWILIPASILHIFDLLDLVINYLDTIAIHAGNIKISAYGVLRMLVFGSMLVWLGSLSRSAGNRIIRRQEELDIGTRELFSKLFEVILAILIFVLLLQVMGINLTALAVFGGAVGVGLGFGLQSIASNFISGIILLLDRSLTDDGENRVGGDLLLMIWHALKVENVEIPFPQREVTIIGERPKAN